MQAMDLMRSRDGGWLITVYCAGCQGQACTIVDDSDMPDGRQGWANFNAALERRGWQVAAEPSAADPYPIWHCPACGGGSPAAPAATQLALFAAAS